MPRMTQPDLEHLMDHHFPGWRLFCRIDAIGDESIDVRMPFREDLVRAGGTIAGPALMGLADTTAYILTLLHAGPVHNAATADLTIHFLVRPEPVDVVARARLLRLGRRLCVCAIDLHAGADLVAHATVAYALPQT